MDDWARHVKAAPDASTVVLARTKAEARALSWLMRERVLARTPEATRAIVEVSRDLDGRVTEPLEIAVGDRIRIGATQWDKQLFNGTVVTVEDLEVRRAEQAAVTRKARNREAAGRVAGTGDETEVEAPLLITARTDDGRHVTFRHDEIRDYRDNIRLDYGYAMTIASAQGLTVDRAFLLLDDRPARETIYPAATRHREGIDIYVNRRPIAFDIADRRPEDEAERPVLDSDVRVWLAERWSRSEPKEAALDYTTDGMWRDAREGVRAGIANRESRSTGTGHHGPGDDRGEHAEIPRPAANDNAVFRIAREMRHAVAGWRHGAAVDAFAAERAEVLAAWDALRERTRDQGDAVALSPAYRETLERHALLLNQATSFRTRPKAFSALLAERGGIGREELRKFEALHERARRHRRAAVMRRVHRDRRQEQGQEILPEEARDVLPDVRPAQSFSPGTEARQGELALQGGGARSRRAPVDAPPRPDAAAARKPPTQGWCTLYKELQRDWNDLAARSRQPGLPLPLIDGYDALVQRVRALDANPDIPDDARDVLTGLLHYYEDQTVAQETARSWLAEAGRHIEHWKALERRADGLGIPVAHLDEYPAWRDAARSLGNTGEALLGDEGSRAWLDAAPGGSAHARLILDRLRARIGETRAEAAGRVEALLAAVARHMDARRALRDAAAGQDIEVTQLSGYGEWRGQADRILEEGKALLSDRAVCAAWLHENPADAERLERVFTRLGRAIRDDDQELARAWREAREKRQRSVLLDRLRLPTDTGAGSAHAGAGNDTPDGVLWRLRRIHDWDGRAAERDKQAQSLERWQTLRETWNRQVDRAGQEGVHVIYTRGYETLRAQLASVARDDPYLDHGARGEIPTLIHRLELAEKGRATVETHRDRLEGRLAYRDDVRGLNASAAWDERPIPDREHYEGWRDSAEEAIAAAERILADRRKHGIHLDGLTYKGESLASAISGLRKVLTEDDRYVAAALAGEREGEDERTRQDRIARLLDDPERLRETRKLRAERSEVRRQEKRRSRSRYQSRGLSI